MQQTHSYQENPQTTTQCKLRPLKKTQPSLKSNMGNLIASKVEIKVLDFINLWVLLNFLLTWVLVGGLVVFLVCWLVWQFVGKLVRCFFVKMDNWCVGWLDAWWIGLLVYLLVCQSVGCCCFFGLLVGWLVRWLVFGWLFFWCVGWW